MVRQLEREVINKYSWLERGNITSGYGVHLLIDFADLDELCKDIEGELDSKSISNSTSKGIGRIWKYN